jgi:hypothetical protein
MGLLLHCEDWLEWGRHPCRPSTRRALSVTAFCLTLAFAAFGQTDPKKDPSKDPIFSTVPFDRWVAQGDHVDIPWKVKNSPPQLDDHQRFLVTVTITIDGKNLARLPGSSAQLPDSSANGGELLMLMQIEDSQGHTFQGHTPVPLSEVTQDLRRSDVTYTQSALLIPGDYRVTLAMLHRASSAHNLAHLTVHVPPLKNDPLANPWEGTPAAEIIGKESEMEEWFHPDLTGRLHLPVEPHRPVRIELLLNAPKSRSAGEYYRQCMSGLLGQLKVLSQMDVRNGIMNITLLDVQHRRAVALSRRDGNLDWNELKPALEKANPNVIDVHALGNGSEESEFLAAEVRRRLQASSLADERSTAPRPILIVLSAPTMLGKDSSGKLPSFGEVHEGNVYLVRYRPSIALQELRDAVADSDSSSGFDARGRGGPPRSLPMASAPSGPYPDEKAIPLHDVLKPLKPRIFDVSNPSQFRETLAAILEELSKM